jgi:hypothetical protein
MSNVLAEIFVPIAVVIAIAVWIFSGRRVDGNPDDGQTMPLPDREPASDADGRDAQTRELDESGTDYVDFGAPERVRRS